MNIAVNTRLLLKDRLEGIGWFTYETLSRISRAHPEHHFTFIFDRPYDPGFIFAPNVTPLVTGPQARHPFLFVLWFEFSIPRALKKCGAELFISPDGYLSLRTRVPQLAVIHDLNFEHYPQDLPWLVRKYYRFFFPRFARKARRIATVSEASASDIRDAYGIKSDLIDVVYDGANAEFRPLTAAEIMQTRESLSGGLPYFVFVGALHPRKNLANLFRAFDLYCSQGGREETALVIVGLKKWWTPRIKEAYEGMKHRKRVFFAGRLSNQALMRAVGAALATTYVSYFEGFGIPIVESFRCGTPVITSNISSMPEVAGDAALLCDPFNPEDIAAAMGRMADDEALRQELIARGHLRQEVFTWDRTAELLWESIAKAGKINQG